MKKLILIVCYIISVNAFAQNSPFEKINFILGNWEGKGLGFGNNQSNIKSSFQLVMDGKYIEVLNESHFDPTEKNPKGEHHIDKGFISFDKGRNLIVFRQFNNEGFINQYVLIDSLSTASTLVFETEKIENFISGGKARWTINKISDTEIETIFDVSFPNSDYTCFGTNKLNKQL